MSFVFFTLLTSAGFFIGILLLLELGRRLGMRHLINHPEAIGKSHRTLETAVFALVGLLLGFTFSGSVTRYTDRLNLVNQEALAIDTVYLRIELLPDASHPPLKALVREFTDERIAAHQAQGDSPESLLHLEKANQLHKELWKQTLAVCKSAEVPAPTAGLVTSAIIDLFGITTTRASARSQHPPTIIYALLCVLVLGGSLLAGYGMAEDRKRSWAHFIALAGLYSVTIFLILNMEYPRLGILGLESADQILIDFRNSMS